MSLIHRSSFTLVVLFASWAGIVRADYRISPIQNSQGEFTSFSLPSISSSGEIVYQADFADIAAGSAIYREGGSGRTLIASTAGELLGFPADPGIDDNGVVALVADLDVGGRSVLRGDGGALTTVASTAPSGLSEISPYVSISNTGVIAYTASPAPLPMPGGRAVFRYYNGVTAVMARQLELVGQTGILEPFSFASDTSFNNVWFQTEVDGRPWIWLGTNPPIVFSGPITSTLTGLPERFVDLDLLSAGSIGQALFRAELLSGIRAICIVSPPIPNSDPYPTLVDDTGQFSDFDQGFLQHASDQYTLVFRASLDAGGVGIYTRTLESLSGPPTVTEKVVAVGDSLGGSTIVEAALGPRPISRDGTVVFWARLADGTTGIYKASPGSGSGGGGGAIDPAVAMVLCLLAFLQRSRARDRLRGTL